VHRQRYRVGFDTLRTTIEIFFLRKEEGRKNKQTDKQRFFCYAPPPPTATITVKASSDIGGVRHR
jgi:hypothetical protein